MKDKKLVKRVQFIFKRRATSHLSLEQMRNVRGGNSVTTTVEQGPSTEPGCVENKPTIGTVSN